MKKRIYVIWDRGEAVALVRANSQSQAVAHVVGDRFEAVVADQDHLVMPALRAMTVQEAGEDKSAEAKASAEAAAQEAALRG